MAKPIHRRVSVISSSARIFIVSLTGQVTDGSGQKNHNSIPLEQNRYKSVDSVSIHHANSRFVTIHQTNDVIVRDVVGYNTYGHGFFIEDGVEQNNTFDHNLGILVKPGIVLPTDRYYEACVEIGSQETFYTDNNGKRNYEPIDTSSCEMLSGKF